MMTSLLEYALKRSPQNKTFNGWLLKLYGKLGLTSLVSEVSKVMSKVDEKDYEKLGCIRYSHYSDYCEDKELELVCKQYKKYYDLHSNENKNKVVKCFKERDFEKINDIMTKNETMKSSYFMMCSDMGLIYLSIFRNATNSNNLHFMFNKKFQMVKDLCDEDNVQPMSKRDLDLKSFKPI